MANYNGPQRCIVTKKAVYKEILQLLDDNRMTLIGSITIKGGDWKAFREDEVITFGGNND
jgi:hypothetical protein